MLAGWAARESTIHDWNMKQLALREVSVLGVILVRIFPHLDSIRTRIISNMDTFYAVWSFMEYLYLSLMKIDKYKNG